MDRPRKKETRELSEHIYPSALQMSLCQSKQQMTFVSATTDTNYVYLPEVGRRRLPFALSLSHSLCARRAFSSPTGMTPLPYASIAPARLRLPSRSGRTSA